MTIAQKVIQVKHNLFLMKCSKMKKLELIITLLFVVCCNQYCSAQSENVRNVDTVKFFKNKSFIVIDSTAFIKSFYYNDLQYKQEMYDSSNWQLRKIIYYDFIDNLIGLMILISNDGEVEKVEYTNKRGKVIVDEDTEVYQIEKTDLMFNNRD